MWHVRGWWWSTAPKSTHGGKVIDLHHVGDVCPVTMVIKYPNSRRGRDEDCPSQVGDTSQRVIMVGPELRMVG